MQYRKLGDTDVSVSVIALGTMTWGEQNTEAEAHSQIDLALEHGVNLLDAAEMYPVPPRPETQGLTESYIGSWLKKTGQRDRIVLASKIVGPATDPKRPSHFRDGQPHFDRKNLAQALDDSLRRLQTDYLDLYQLHWPDRTANTFGTLGFPWQDDPAGSTPIEETLSILKEFIVAGKIRAIGLSNETPWGVAQFLKASENLGLPRVVSIQNPYSLLNRLYEIGLSEFSRRENVGLLAYSPLAFGVLSGKYLDGQRPAAARLTLFERFSRYSSEAAETATRAYVELARNHGLSPAQLALAFVNSRPFVTSNIIGATTLAQLQENLDSIHVQLDETVLHQLEAIHARIPNPCP
ncbi:NADP(H)-dependent aldo-keto reductase [Aquitalea denitrificans]|uniref:NADP(H)-dependent aldo-keto reductase n=1 Tax=Aquitalea denitrificans TaxID=519081 RepID=UPI0013585C6E|nr:NADP(H)-dependent aldo-keto reductase [Aquitalea denitrificans]